MLSEPTTITELAEELEDSIAIIGMAGRFPKAENIDAFWQTLCAGQSGMTVHQLSAEEQAQLPKDWVPVTLNLEGAADFDANLYNLSAREAAMIDPQQRCFLEVCQTAMEHAGYAPSQVDGKVGVFAGVSPSQYFIENVIHHVDSHNAMSLFSGSLPDQLATRVAWHLNLRGPAMTLATACSTSLTALSVAVQHLESFHCDMALVGGSSLQLGDEKGYQYIEGAIFSQDGICRPFDEKASGTLTGSGVAAVVLKRTKEALEDGDNIIAVIRSTALNNDGNEKVGYTAPSENAQAELVIEAMTAADLSVEQVKFVEAHGTATKLGDPIELNALSRAYEELGATAQQTYVGSLKTNYGHLDAAAGIAGVIKAALVLDKGVIPPMPHFEQPNPAFAMQASPLRVNQQAVALNQQETLLAGVSSFGIGGTNAHVVLQNMPAKTQATAQLNPWSFVPLSAKSTKSLSDYNQAILAEAERRGNLSRDCVKTMVHGRERYPLRRAVLLHQGEVYGQVGEHQAQHQAKVAFIFPGQGTQFVQMGMALYRSEPEYRRHLDQVAAYALNRGVDIIQLLHSDDAQLAITKNTQPVLFAVEYSLANLLAYYGIQADAYLGHSLGEWVAACLSGLFSLEDALGAVIERARLMDSMPTGAMLSISKSWQSIADLMPDGVELAVENSHDTCVIAGSFEAIQEAELILSEEGLSPKRLKTSHAYHSQQMAPMLSEFERYLTKLKFTQPSTPWISNRSGEWVDFVKAATPQYWSEHVRHTVKFADGLALLKSQQYICVEVGPGQLFTQLLKRQDYHYGVATIGNAKQLGHEQQSLLRAIAQLWTCGVEPNWDAMLGEGAYQRQVMPTYPFERKTYWWGEKRLSHTEVAASVTPESEPQAHGLSPEAQILSVFSSYFDRDDLTAEDDYFSLGGDSLLLVSVLKDINSKLGTSLTLDQFLQAPTASQLSQFVTSQSEQKNGTELALTLSETLQPNNTDVQVDAALITGCTGFWGIHLLQQLLDSSDSTLYCLVRAEDESAARQRLYQTARHYGLPLQIASSRIKVIIGDICEPLFGLPSEAFEALGQQVSKIYHLAASVNHFYGVESLRAANIDSVTTCLQLAAQGPKKRLIFASSISVYSNTAYVGETQVTEQPELLTGKFSSGYGHSKWAAEQLIWQAKARGFDTLVLRAGNITGPQESGQCNEKDAIWALVKGCIQVSAYPRSAAGLYVDMLPVDQACAITHTLAEHAPAGSVYHLVPHNLLTFHDLAEQARSLGYPLQILDDTLWAKRVTQMLTEAQQRPLYRMLQAQEGEAEVNKQLRFNNDLLCETLQKEHHSLPEISAGTVNRYIQRLMERGFLPCVTELNNQEKSAAVLTEEE
ncbi:thioester reductase domain-containing protein [Pseudoalteromonas peptidolytica]|uniref:thioester reductase domain-containing protein n=1 Tax=Pseudoalteromonas peptidolytica TaxID=61150 RepID=UPI00298E302F|nr:thioester reductase domain-containing protein [Pseudoalteromonas peptidolytica]MDW7549098.1 thioester reductase domain-containing protein [Pseudoalteromonas peptidolytica]